MSQFRSLIGARGIDHIENFKNAFYNIARSRGQINQGRLPRAGGKGSLTGLRGHSGYALLSSCPGYTLLCCCTDHGDIDAFRSSRQDGCQGKIRERLTAAASMIVRRISRGMRACATGSNRLRMLGFGITYRGKGYRIATEDSSRNSGGMMRNRGSRSRGKASCEYIWVACGVVFVFFRSDL
ncbi:hypothetical protein FIBSPDRAFT_493308 [Athelia psychrophila]|uniref:Uncharacterized protein n=1 Tax=Athelia psychrophila TaxID=1759441 RepID=A0A167TU10_9AGAM|nr:hypothetical protein FIBSPDRAFT_493308 [Fibularhizoctonia sp. CBS 109695]